MRPAYWAVAIWVGLASTGYSQDVHKSSDWKKMYQDASTQLRAAQDRKSELAAENAKLETHLAEAQKKLQVCESQLNDLRVEAGNFADQTFMLHAFYADWQVFVASTPGIGGRWDAFLGQIVPELPDKTDLLCDPRWPLD